MSRGRALVAKLLANFRKPTQPRCSCGRYCSSHEDVPDMKAKLISELSAQHKHVPGYFTSRSNSQEGRG